MKCIGVFEGKINSIVSQKNKVKAGMAHHMLQWKRKLLLDTERGLTAKEWLTIRN
jgi:hypothetical protein